MRIPVRCYGRFMQADPGDVSSRFLDAIHKTAARETTADEVGLCTGYPFTSHTKRGLNKFDLTCELPQRVWIVQIESSLQEMAIWEAVLVGHLIPRSSFSSTASFLCIWGERDQNRKRFNQENTCIVIFVHFDALTAWPRHCPCDFSGRT